MTARPAQPSDWDAAQYLKFEDERSRPARDLLAQVPLQKVRTAVDLGCGPGNSTELLMDRYPEARVVGLDSSKDMLRQASERLPGCQFVEADLSAWIPTEPVDLLFANATFQWVPDHMQAIRRLIETLAEGGVFAAQMPDNTMEPTHCLMEEVAKRGPWADRLANSPAARQALPSPETYYDLLKPLCRNVEIWHAIYYHVLADPRAIVEWFKGSALRPYLSVLLRPSEAEDFLAAYTGRIAQHYPPRFDGKTLLRFPRLFIVAVR